MTLPTFQGIGTGSETSCSWPTHAADDWGFLLVEHGAGTVATPTGCTIVPGFPLVQSAGSTLSAFMRKATGSSEAALALSGGTDHMWGTIFTIRGADLTTPIHNLGTMIQQGAITAGSVPGGYTQEDDCLVVHAVAWIIDNAGPIASSWANTSLGSVTEQYDAGTVTGTGGGLTIASGTLATAGAFAMGTVTLSSTGYSAVTFAFRPPAAVADTGLQLSTAARNAMLDAIETEGGTSAIMKIRTGSAPATCATADSGTVLATLNLPSDYFAAAASGSKALAGTWEDVSADATGTAGHFRIYKSNGTTCFIQGTVTVSGGGGHLIVSTVSFTAGDTVTVSTFSMTAPGA